MEYVLPVLFWGVLFGPPVFGMIIAIVVYRWFLRRKFRSVGAILSVIVLSFSVYYLVETYLAFYPPESFYKDEFERYTKLKFPESGNFISKVATYPDLHGHYIADAMVQFSDSDFTSLLRKVNNNVSFSIDTLDGDINHAIESEDQYFRQMTKGIQVTNDSEKRNIVLLAKKEELWIFFFNDMKTIVICKRLN